MSNEYKSVEGYIAARQAGDADGASAICREVCARYATRTTDGSELAALYEANRNTPVADPSV